MESSDDEYSHEEKMTLAAVQKCAAKYYDLIQIYLNEESKVISYRDEASDARINVYYATGTVGTSLNNEIKDRNQTFRLKVTMTDLDTLFQCPRYTTNTVYRRSKDQRLFPGNPDSEDSNDEKDFDENSENADENAIPDEKEALTQQLYILEPQVALIKKRIKELDKSHKKMVYKRRLAATVAAKAKALADAEKTYIMKQLEELKEAKVVEVERWRAETERLKSIRAVQEAEIKAAAAAVARRAEEDKQRSVREQQLRREPHYERNDLRGFDIHHSLRHSGCFPEATAHVKSVAVCGGGYAYSVDNTSCGWDGIPAEVTDILKKHNYTSIDHIALGQCGQFYIGLTNGQYYIRGPQSLETAMRQIASCPKYVSFGPWGEYFVLFENHNKIWSAGLETLLPYNVYSTLTRPGVYPLHVYLGDTVHTTSKHLPYYITLDVNGNCWYDHLPQPVVHWLQHVKTPNQKVRQLLIGEGANFVARYS